MAADKNDIEPDFNLDTVERGETFRPFRPVVNGKVVTMTDPADLDFMDLLDIEHPVLFLRYCVSDEDREHIKNANLPGWKFNKLIEAYQKHYGLAKGQGVAGRI